MKKLNRPINVLIIICFILISVSIVNGVNYFLVDSKLNGNTDDGIKKSIISVIPKGNKSINMDSIVILDTVKTSTDMMVLFKDNEGFKSAEFRNYEKNVFKITSVDWNSDLNGLYTRFLSTVDGKGYFIYFGNSYDTPVRKVLLTANEKEFTINIPSKGNYVEKVDLSSLSNTESINFKYKYFDEKGNGILNMK